MDTLLIGETSSPDPATVPPMARRSTPESRPMNALARLILRRKDELELSWYEIAERGGFSSHTIAYALAKKAEHRQPPRAETLIRLAKALELPVDVVKLAAAEAAGYELTEVPTTLEVAEDVRVIAQAMAEMSVEDRTKLRRLAQAFVMDSREADRRAVETAALHDDLSDAAAKVRKSRVRPIRPSESDK